MQDTQHENVASESSVAIVFPIVWTACVKIAHKLHCSSRLVPCRSHLYIVYSCHAVSGMESDFGDFDDIDEDLLRSLPLDFPFEDEDLSDAPPDADTDADSGISSVESSECEPLLFDWENNFFLTEHEEKFLIHSDLCWHFCWEPARC